MGTAVKPEAGRLTARVRRRRIIGGIVFVVLVGGMIGALQVDMVQQTLLNIYLAVTGGNWKLHGKEQAVTFASRTLNNKRSALVYTPPDYDSPANRGRRYPVLYLLHGFAGPANAWSQYGHAAQEVDHLIVDGKIPPLIVICPDAHGQGSFGDSEYLNAPVRPTGETGARMADFITGELVAWMDGHYRTISSPSARIIGGVSTGGYGAANLALQHPDIFGTIFSYSGYFTADPKHFATPIWGAVPDSGRLQKESPLLRVENATVAERAHWKNMAVFIGYGDHEPLSGRREADQFVEDLRAAGLHVETAAPLGKHSWTVWRFLLRESLVRFKDRLTTVPTTSR